MTAVPEDPLEWAVSAMNEAADRVPRCSSNDPAAVFAAIGETLWWIVVVDDNLKSRDEDSRDRFVREALGARPLLEALRYARNRFTHRVDVLRYVEERGDLSGDPRGYRTRWRWRSLPPERWEDFGRHAKSAESGHKAYQETLAGSCVHQSLVHALTPLRAAWYQQRPTPTPPDDQGP